MNGNYDPNNVNNRRRTGTPASSESSQRPRVRRPSGSRPVGTQTPSRPLRPQQRRGETAATRTNARGPVPGAGTRSAPQKAPTAEEKKINRNVILAAILFVLVIITVLIFGIQSCAKDDEDENYQNGDDNVILNTTEPENANNNSVPVYAEYNESSATLNIDSGYGILIDLDSNTVIASKGGDERIYPASMTKVMTLIVAYENIPDLDSATYTFDAVMLDELFRANASVAGFLANETVTARDLLYGAILPSGGDATNALAELVAGSEEDFAYLMNEKVKELGLENTHFVTVSGLHDDDHYSTCHDMAKILEYAISNPEMRKILSTYQYTTSPTEQHPEGILLTSTLFSRMAGDEVEGLFVQGGKTGYTIEAKNCLCTFAANCREDESPYTDPQYILVTAFAGNNEYTPVYDAIDVYREYCTN